MARARNADAAAKGATVIRQLRSILDRRTRFEAIAHENRQQAEVRRTHYTDGTPADQEFDRAFFEERARDAEQALEEIDSLIGGKLGSREFADKLAQVVRDLPQAGGGTAATPASASRNVESETKIADAHASFAAAIDSLQRLRKMEKESLQRESSARGVRLETQAHKRAIESLRAAALRIAPRALTASELGRRVDAQKQRLPSQVVADLLEAAAEELAVGQALRCPDTADELPTVLALKAQAIEYVSSLAVVRGRNGKAKSADKIALQIMVKLTRGKCPLGAKAIAACVARRDPHRRQRRKMLGYVEQI